MQNRIFQLFALTFLITTFFACDCVVDETGVILDGTSGAPLEDVTVIYNKRTYKTDSNGIYNISFITGFCSDQHFVFEKEGYKPMILNIEMDGDEIIYKVNNKSEFLDYDSPKYFDSTKKSYIVGEWVELTSKNFSVRNDTLTILLDKKI